MTRASGVTPRIARSKVARVTPLACASGHSSLDEGGEGLAAARARRRASKTSSESQSEAGEHCVASRFDADLIAARPRRRRDAPAGRRSRARAAPCARSPASVCDSRTRSSIEVGRGAEQADDAGAFVVAGLGLGRRTRLGLARRRQFDAAAEDRLQHRDHVGGVGDQRRALLEQAVGAFRARIERRAGHREHLAALFAGEPRRDQRAGAARRLDDHDAERQPGDQPVAAGKVARARLPGERHFRQRDALRQDRFEQARRARPGRCGRWPPASTATVPLARLARCAAASMPRARPETMPKPASPSSRASDCGEFGAGGGGVARADDGDQRPGQHRAVAAHREQRRRVVDHLQPQRVVRFAERDEMHAAGARRLQLGSASSRGQMRPGRAAPPRRASAGSASSAARAPPK